MKVLILSTFSRTGGAAIAASRLLKALNDNGVEATMLVRRSLGVPFWKEKWGGIPAIMERLCVWLATGLHKEYLFAADIANTGDDIINTPEFKEADVIHLHWINQGFLSLPTLQRIVQSGKRIVWTMHDQWAMTGICHYSDDCRGYEKDCNNCQLLRYGMTHGAARRVFNIKRRIYGEGRITFVTCSRWLASMARTSALAKGQEVVSVPNPIDTSLFAPMDRTDARTLLGLSTEGTKILFGCQKVTDERKGLHYLIQATAYLPDIEVLLVGGSAQSTRALMPRNIKITCVGQVNDPKRMAALYAAADAFVTPSLQDNLPNTIMEAMACATPCVGFNVGGIPEMIDHKENGFVAQYKSAESLAQGIGYVTDPKNAARLAKAAREKVMLQYSERSVAERYIDIYKRQD